MNKLLILLLTIISFGAQAQKITMTAQGQSNQGVKYNTYYYLAGGLALPKYSTAPTKYSIDPQTNDTIRITQYIDSATGNLMVIKKDNSYVKLVNYDSLISGFYSRTRTDSIITFIYNKSKGYTDSLVAAQIVNSTFGGSVVPTSNPAPSVNTYYFATQAGTYTNMGGVVVSANSFAVISYKASGSVWTISQTALDLSNYFTKSQTYTAIDSVLQYQIGSKQTVTTVISEPKTVGNFTWTFTTSTFSGWGFNIGKAQHFNTIQFYIQVKSGEANLTSLQFAIKSKNKAGAIITTKTLSGLNIAALTPTLVTVTLDSTIQNAALDTLYCMFMSSVKLDYFGDLTPPQNFPNPSYAKNAYQTNGTLNFNNFQDQSNQYDHYFKLLLVEQKIVPSVQFSNNVAITSPILVSTTTKANSAAIPDSAGNLYAVNVQYVQWMHPRAPTELFGDVKYGANSVPGISIYEQINRKIALNSIDIPMSATADAALTIRVYKSSVYNLNPNNLTLLEQKTYAAGSFNTDPTKLQTISLSGQYLIDSGSYVYVFAVRTAGTSIYMQRWTTLCSCSPERHNFVFETALPDPWNGNWSTAGAGFYQTTFTLNAINSTVANIQTRLSTLESGLSPYTPRIVLPKTIYAVVGFQKQIYYDAIVLGLEDISGLKNCYVEITGAKGKMMNRYWTYTPAASDTGTAIMTITVYDYNGNVVQTKTFTLVTSAATGLAGVKYLLQIGDSTILPSTTTQKIRELILGLGGSPVTCVGTQGSGLNKQEGHGGKDIQFFTTAGLQITYVFTVSGVSSITPGATYTNNGSTFTVGEINLAGGSGYFKADITSGTNAPTSSGTLTKASGVGDATISFSASALDDANPCWNYTTNKLDIGNFMTNIGMDTNHLNVITFDLGINNSATSTIRSSTAIANDIIAYKLLIDSFIAKNPNVHIIINLTKQCTVMPSGWGANYGSVRSKIIYLLNVWNLREAMIANFETNVYSSHVTVGSGGQSIDRYNGYQNTTTTYATDLTATEIQSINALHPSSEGYKQIGTNVMPEILYWLKN